MCGIFLSPLCCHALVHPCTRYHHPNSSPKLGEVPEGRRGLFPPRANQDFICLLWGKAEVRVAHYPLGTQNKRLLFILGERRYMPPNDARHQSLRPCYRTRRHRSAQSRYRTRHQLPITNHQSPIGSPKVNLDFICLLLGERRHESSQR